MDVGELNLRLINAQICFFTDGETDIVFSREERTKNVVTCETKNKRQNRC